MIQLVWERAIAADIAPVYVATDDRDIANVITSAGGKAIMTRTDHPSGSDRIYEALETIDPEKNISQILNLQGDLPDLSPDIPHLLGDILDLKFGYLAKNDVGCSAPDLKRRRGAEFPGDHFFRKQDRNIANKSPKIS